MLDIQFILQNKEIVKNAIRNKQKPDVDLDKVEELYNTRKDMLQKVEEGNRLKKQYAEERDIEKGKELKADLQRNEVILREVSLELTNLLDKIPNVPLPDVPIGKDEDENVVIRSVGDRRVFDFPPLPHWEIGKDRDFIDNERAAKTSGARFTFIKGDLALLQFAIIQYVMSVVTDQKKLEEIKGDLDIKVTPFIPVIPPVMIKPEILHGMARLNPKEDKFYIESDNLNLVGSAEHTLGAMHVGETIDEKELPLRYIGYSTAFRREAGSYGKDTKGILRQHQFDKLEFECFTLPEDSKLEQDFLVKIQEYLMQGLGLPYTVVMVCTGDMGGPDLRQIDIETWMPGQDKYRETHSADYMGEFQARRLGIKFNKDGEKDFIHMNDATCFAIGRILIAIIENYQNADKTITIPEVLRRFFPKDVDRI